MQGVPRFRLTAVLEEPLKLANGGGMERALELVMDDRLADAVEVLQPVREGQSDRLSRRYAEQAGVALDERPEAVGPRVGGEVEQHDTTVAVDADRQSAG